MKVLTMRRPWAELLLNGCKITESRKGAVLSRHIGPVAIHVSAKSPGWEKDLAELRERFKLVDDDFAVPFDIDGCIIGTVFAEPTHRHTKGQPVTEKMHRDAVFVDLDGRYLTPIHSPRWLASPIPAKGRLGLWDYELAEL